MENKREFNATCSNAKVLETPKYYYKVVNMFGEKELEELTDTELKNDYVGWFCYDYTIEELEKVARDEMIWDMTEDKRRYLKDYEREELEDYIN